MTTRIEEIRVWREMLCNGMRVDIEDLVGKIDTLLAEVERLERDKEMLLRVAKAVNREFLIGCECPVQEEGVHRKICDEKLFALKTCRDAGLLEGE